MGTGPVVILVPRMTHRLPALMPPASVARAVARCSQPDLAAAKMCITVRSLAHKAHVGQARFMKAMAIRTMAITDKMERTPAGQRAAALSEALKNAGMNRPAIAIAPTPARISPTVGFEPSR